MKKRKYFPHISSFLLTLVIVVTVSGFIFPQTTEAACGITEIGCQITERVVPFIVGIILKLVALLTGLAGIILNGVIYLTIVKVSENYSNIPAINEAWKVIRDIANMGFIFVLLYAAIMTILGIGEDVKKLIVRIVVVAILINFSLFFTKIVIDASNVLAITFYDAIAPGALNTTGTFDLTQLGLSNAFMQHLSLTSLYKVAGNGQITIPGIITIGVMGSIMLLVAAFVFFAVAIMLVIRYVILILVLILSPIAFIAVILPALKPQATKWKDALIGQAFFAPIYFMLTWVTLSVLGGVMNSFQVAVGTTSGSVVSALNGIQTDADGNVVPNAGTFSMFLNFAVVIAFLIISLIIAKDWANKAGPGVAGLTKWAMGAAGGATLGMAGRFGRGTVGRAGAAVGESEWLKKRAEKGSMAARLTLAAGRKTGGASFDVRGTPLGGTLEAGKAQKDGFIELKKQQAKREADFATSLAPSAKAIAKDKTLLGNKAEIDREVNILEKEKQRKVGELRSSEELKSAETKEKSAYDAVSKLEAEAGAAEDTVKEAKIRELEIAKVKLEEIKKEAGEARKRVREEIERVTTDYDARKDALRGTEVKATSDIRKERFAQAIERSSWAKARGYNYDAAAQIRKGKSAKDKAADILKDLQKEGVISEEEKPETPPQTPLTPPPAPPTT